MSSPERASHSAGVLASSGGESRRAKGIKPGDGAELERRVGRAEFADGALVRLRVPIRVDAEAGRDVLTDIDVLAIDVDGRLRLSRSILECKSGRGQSGEPDRLLWLAGLQRYLGFDRAVLVRQTVSRRGRGIARTLGLRALDGVTLTQREKGHEALPARFGHLDGSALAALERRSDTQLRALGHISPEVVGFLRHDSLCAEPHRALAAIVAVGRMTEGGAVLPSQARGMLAGYSFVALLVAALTDAGRLDDISPSELLERTRRAHMTGSPDGTQVLHVLGRADEFMKYSVDQVHAAYQARGAKRPDVTLPSLRDAVMEPPVWAARYVDLAQRLRANPSVARQLLQTADLAVFEALVGGKEHESPGFDHLFTPDHHYLLNVAIRCLADIAGHAIAEVLAPALELDFDRGGGERDRSGEGQ